ncbi:MAG: MucR family transcriptional regulator [Desulfovibrio sp.]|jgi:predicted transcriptional regulator|nr:MucR family transcriptional regulator [Desulfovibrio sp.]
MSDFVKEALEIVKAQAAVRAMTEEEITSMVKKLVSGLSGLACACGSEEAPASASSGDAAKSIKDRSIQCMECGKVFKILSAKHLALHGLDAKSYREKWGLKKGTALAAKALQRERRKKMHEMKLWERRGKAKKEG